MYLLKRKQRKYGQILMKVSLYDLQTILYDAKYTENTGEYHERDFVKQ